MCHVAMLLASLTCMSYNRPFGNQVEDFHDTVLFRCKQAEKMAESLGFPFWHPKAKFF